MKCRILGHRWVLTISHGDASEEMCRRCETRQVYVDGELLPPKEAELKSAEMWRYASGIMWLLDNVEPTCSAGREE